MQAHRRRADSRRRKNVESLPHLHALAAASQLPRLAHAASDAVDPDPLALTARTVASLPLIIDPHRITADANRSDEPKRGGAPTGGGPRLRHQGDTANGAHLRGERHRVKEDEDGEAGGKQWGGSLLLVALHSSPTATIAA